MVFLRDGVGAELESARGDDSGEKCRKRERELFVFGLGGNSTAVRGLIVATGPQ